MLRFAIITVVMVMIIRCDSIIDSKIENDSKINNNSNSIYKGSGQESYDDTSFKESVALSSLIVDAVVKEINFYYIFGVPEYAIMTLSVLNVIKGECGDEILLRRWGINEELEFIETDMIPVYSKDKRYILCLLKSSSSSETYGVYGLYDGAFEIVNGKVACSDKANLYVFFEQKNKNGLSIEDFKREIKGIMNAVKVIEFNIPKFSYYDVIVYNMYGQEIEVLRENAPISSGIRKFLWDGTTYASGIYICRLKSKDYTEEIKIALLK